MKICIIAPDYPDSKRPTNTFIKNLVDQWGILGHQLTVIAPFSITKTKMLSVPQEIPTSYNIDIRRPKIATVSELVLFGHHLSREMVMHSVYKQLCKLEQKPDVIYCHFWEQVLSAYKYSQEYNIPVVVACGESVVPTKWSEEPMRTMCNAVKHVICVSTKNKNESIQLGLTIEEKCSIHPNGIDGNIFHLSDQTELRRRLGVKDEDFLIAFVGWFINRKGANRISEAIDKLQDKTIKSIFIGKGKVGPTCEGIVFKGTLPHDEIPYYLNCADVFVLPTLKEGCCNAIVEAMACGLPIISSDKDFNWDILDKNNSIMINPGSVDEIANAIKLLKDDLELRKTLRESAIQKAATLTIKQRALDIIKELDKIISNV